MLQGEEGVRVRRRGTYKGCGQVVKYSKAINSNRMRDERLSLRYRGPRSSAT